MRWGFSVLSSTGVNHGPDSHILNNQDTSVGTRVKSRHVENLAKVKKNLYLHISPDEQLREGASRLSSLTRAFKASQPLATLAYMHRNVLRSGGTSSLISHITIHRR